MRIIFITILAVFLAGCASWKHYQYSPNEHYSQSAYEMSFHNEEGWGDAVRPRRKMPVRVGAYYPVPKVVHTNHRLSKERTAEKLAGEVPKRS